MLHCPDEAALKTEPSIRRFLHLILLLTVREHAAVVRLLRIDDRIEYWMFCQETWFEGLSPPGDIWPSLMNVLWDVVDWDASRVSRSARPAPRSRRWPWTPAPPPARTFYGALLEHQVGTYYSRWAVAFDGETTNEVHAVTFVPSGPPERRDEAERVLQSLIDSDNMIEFEDL